MHRTKKKNDVNGGKWVGIGGKIERGESVEQCLLREMREESGIVPERYEYRGTVDFVSDEWEEEIMHLFTATVSERHPLPECDEGELFWVDASELRSLPMWEGDRVFFDLIDAGAPFFRLRLIYEGEKLVKSELL